MHLLVVAQSRGIKNVDVNQIRKAEVVLKGRSVRSAASEYPIHAKDSSSRAESVCPPLSENFPPRPKHVDVVEDLRGDEKHQDGENQIVAIEAPLVGERADGQREDDGCRVEETLCQRYGRPFTRFQRTAPFPDSASPVMPSIGACEGRSLRSFIRLFIT